MRVALALLPDSRSTIPSSMRAELFSLDVSRPSPSRKGVPHLGVSTLTAYLRENSVDVTPFDFRTDVTDVGSDQIPHLSEQKRWVCEAVTLELLIPILDRYFANCDLATLLHVDRTASYYRRYAHARGMFLVGLLASIDELHELVAASLDTWSEFDIIGFSTYQSNMYAVMLACMALRLRNPDLTIVVGGPEVTQSFNSAKLLLSAGLVDAVVPGEALGSTLQLIQASAGHTPIAEVPGVMTLEAGEIRQSTVATPRAIDELPFPDFSDFPREDYYPFSYPIGTSRGCPFRCNFCSEKDMFGRFRQMSIDGAYGTVRRATDSLRCQKIFFGDSLVNTNEKWLQALAQRMVDDGLDISWESYFRATTNRKMLSVLKKSGLTRAIIGLESISDELLSVMVKRQTSVKNIGSINAFFDEGIPTSLSLIVGYPGEREREHDDLVELLWKLTERNQDIGRDARAEYARSGFESLPTQAYPEVAAFPLPFYLKPMSEIFDQPDQFGLRVTPYGDMFSEYTAIPERVTRLLASMPHTFESEQVPAAEVFRRLRRVESVPHLDGRLTSFGQRVHTMFHGLRDEDRLALSDKGAFEAATGDAELTYRSSGLQMEISCADVSPETMSRIEKGGTLGELVSGCTSGTKSGETQLRHMLAMAAVENNVQVSLK